MAELIDIPIGNGESTLDINKNIDESIRKEIVEHLNEID